MPWQTDPSPYLKKTYSIQTRRPGLKWPNAWVPGNPQSRNMVWPIKTTQNNVLVLLKASAPASTLIHMLGARDQASVPSQMQSPPLQMNAPALPCMLCLCMPPLMPTLCLPPHARPLPLWQQALLHVIPLAGTLPQQSHSYFCPQVQCLDSHLHLFLPLHLGTCLCLLPL